MAVPIGSAFAGLRVVDTAIGEPIKASTIRTVIADQGHGYERATGLAANQAGTTASSTNAAHRHNHSTSGRGTLLVRTFSAMVHGTRGPNADVDAFTPGLTTYAAPFTIIETGSTADADDLPCKAHLIYVPSGWVNRDILFLMDTSSDPDMWFTVRDDTGAAVTGMENIRLKENADTSSRDASQMAYAASAAMGFSTQHWGATFQVPSAGVYYVDVRTNLRARERVRVIYGSCVVGVYRLGQGVVLNPNAWTQYRDGVNVQVGDPDATNAWQPIDEKWVPSTGDSPLHVGLIQKLMENAALVYEKATGLPAPGNDALTITRGHTNSGATGDSPEIGVAHVACSFGGFVGLSDSVTEVSGHFSRAPCAKTTSGVILAIGRTYMPRSANTTTGTSKLKSAVLVWVDGAKAGAVEASVDMSFGSTTRNFVSTVGLTNAYQVLQTPSASTNAYAFTENAINTWDVQFHRTTVGHTNNHVQVASVLWYTEE